MRFLLITLFASACALPTDIDVVGDAQDLIDPSFPGCYLTDTQPTINATMTMRRMAVAYAATISVLSPAGNYRLGATKGGELAWPISYQGPAVKSWWSHAVPAVGKCYGDKVDVTYTAVACDVSTNRNCGSPTDTDIPVGYGEGRRVTFVGKCNAAGQRVPNTPVYVRWDTSATYKSVPETWNGAVCPCPDGHSTC